MDTEKQLRQLQSQ